MNIMVKCPTGKLGDRTYQVKQDMSVGDLKQYLSTEYPGKPCVSKQRIICCGRLLRNEESLKDCYLNDNSPDKLALHLVCPLDIDKKESGDRIREEDEDEETREEYMNYLQQFYLERLAESTEQQAVTQPDEVQARLGWREWARNMFIRRNDNHVILNNNLIGAADQENIDQQRQDPIDLGRLFRLLLFLFAALISSNLFLLALISVIFLYVEYGYFRWINDFLRSFFMWMPRLIGWNDDVENDFRNHPDESVATDAHLSSLSANLGEDHIELNPETQVQERVQIERNAWDILLDVLKMGSNLAWSFVVSLIPERPPPINFD